MNAIENLAESFSSMPGIGKKTAMRLAYFCLKADAGFLQQFASELTAIQSKIKKCSVCGSYTEVDPCPICSDPTRDTSTICVVEQAQDVVTINGSGEYSGVFHVLDGVIAPLEGIGPEKLAIPQLIKRLNENNVKEVIFALNPTIEGDTTALYLQKILQEINPELKITRLASGLPVGGDIEYADKLTLARSFRARMTF